MSERPVLTFTRCQYWKKQTKVEVKNLDTEKTTFT